MIDRQRKRHGGSVGESMEALNSAMSPDGGVARQSMDYPSLGRYLLRYFVPLLILIWGTVAAVMWVEAEIPQPHSNILHITLSLGVGVSLLLLTLLFFYVHASRSKRHHLLIARNLSARLQAVMDTAPDAILTFDEAGRMDSFNAAALRIFAGSEQQFTRAELKDLIPEGYEELLALMRKNAHREGGSLLNIRREFNARRYSGDWFPLELSMSETQVDGRCLFIAIARDISQRKAVEEQIHRKVMYDDLTGLPNRILLRSKLESIISLSQRRAMHGALLFMDLDNFKNINDSMGHLAGDILLSRVGERLTRTLRSEDVISRLGGDEFVVVLPMLSEDINTASVLAREVAEKVRLSLNQPVMLEGHEYVTTPSIGIVLFPSEGMDADDLLKQADTAMYRAKSSGRNTIRFFHPSMQAEVNDRLQVGKELHLAVEQGQLELYLQPQVDARYGCVVGAEALIRWNHPVRGLLGPAAFIPHAEELGMITEIGEWTLREGFSILQRLLKELPCPGLECLAINVSPRHFRNPSFVSHLREMMLEYKVPLHRIELEITENLLMEDLEEAVVKMTAVREMGIRFAIDDFGTGFSSLSYLKRLPVGRLKIDRSFVSGVDGDPHNAAIVETILAMARIQQLSVTAEGVERWEECDWLQERDCNHIQGFLFSRPLRVDDFIGFCQTFGKEQAGLQELRNP